MTFDERDEEEPDVDLPAAPDDERPVDPAAAGEPDPVPDDERRVPLDDADEPAELPDEELDEPAGIVVNTGEDQDPGAPSG